MARPKHEQGNRAKQKSEENASFLKKRSKKLL